MKNKLLLIVLCFCSALSAHGAEWDLSSESLTAMTAREAVTSAEAILAAGHVFSSEELQALNLLLEKCRAEEAADLEIRVQILKMSGERRIDLQNLSSTLIADAWKQEQEFQNARAMKSFYQSGAAVSLLLTAASLTTSVIFSSMSLTSYNNYLGQGYYTAGWFQHFYDWKKFELWGYGFAGLAAVCAYGLFTFESLQ